MPSSSAAAANKTTLPSYGAVAAGEAEQGGDVDRSFDADQTYYLKDDRRWTVKRFMLIFVPLLAFGLIVGAIVLFLLKDFNHLYPGPGGGGGGGTSTTPYNGGKGHNTKSSASSGNVAPSTPHTSEKQHNDYETRTPSKETPPDNDAGASCAVHPDCAKLELLGDCCPTSKGVMLSCC